jgi:ADP-heptose:LPS heptosyltransferase
LASTCNELAERLLDLCLRGAGRPPELLRALTGECSPALFRVVVEGLADRFEPALCDVYAELMSEALACAEPSLDPAALVDRYRRVRMPRRCTAEPAAVFVLSRVTLGADIAVTSVILDAAKRRFPRAEIVLVGPPKNQELFAADPRVGRLPVGYRRGSLADRLAAWAELREQLARPDSIVVDTDSRLTQLGLLPVCPEERYFFFESRAYGADTEDPLPLLAARWCAETLGVEDAAPYVAVPPSERPATVTVSLGVGENPAKRLPDPFERDLLALLASTGHEILIDRGAGGEEAARVDRAIAGLSRIRTWEGSFAGFASYIANATLYVGYDSAGQHVAAAARVPLVSIFAGYPSVRMFHRWRPEGKVIRAGQPPDPDLVLAQVRAAIS